MSEQQTRERSEEIMARVDAETWRTKLNIGVDG